jgi:hypothetical protein
MEQEQRLTRKGTVARDEDGSFLLVNENNQAFKTTEAVVAIWHMCDGKTFDELSSEVANAANIAVEEVREPLQELLARLKEANLLE